MASTEKFPCYCCGYLVFDEVPDSYEICPVCGRQDDATWDLNCPFEGGGANKISLYYAQRHPVYRSVKRYTRDTGWRPIDRDRDCFQPIDPFRDPNAITGSPKRLTALYYWRRAYWLRKDPEAYKIGAYCLLPRHTFSEDQLPEARARLVRVVELLADEHWEKNTDEVNRLCFDSPPYLLDCAGGAQLEDFGLGGREQRLLWALDDARADLSGSWAFLKSAQDEESRDRHSAQIREGAILVSALARRLKWFLNY